MEPLSSGKPFQRTSDTVPSIDGILYLSRFVHLFRRGSTVALYHSLKNTVIYMGVDFQPLLDVFRQGAPTRRFLEGISSEHNSDAVESLSKLYAADYLITDPSLEMQAVEAIRNRLLSEPDIDVLYLLLTDKCNFACTYCFISGGMPHDYKTSYMSKQTAKKAIDLFAANINSSEDERSRKSIIMYGGEPLLNWSTLSFALDYITDLREKAVLPKKTGIDIITNGSLITSSIAATLKRYHLLNIAVSLDGPEHIHDRCRIYHDGRGTFSDVIRDFGLLKDAGINVGVSCTLDYHNVETLPDITQWIITELGVKILGFNLLNDSIDRPPVQNDFTTQSAHQLIRAFDLCRKYGVYEDRIIRKVSDFVHRRLRVNDCAGCGCQFVVAPDGALGVCHGYLGTRKYFVHNVNSPNTFDAKSDPVFLEWRSRSPLNMNQCIDCPALGMCGGGCPHDAELRSGSIWGLDERFCIHAKVTLDWLIWDLYDKIVSNPKR
jgi:uncharacterized protein